MLKSQGFSAKERLSNKKEFDAVYKRGRRFRTNAFIHACILSRPGDTARLGLSVSRRVGKAVVRNKVKRRLREVFRRNKGALKKGVDMVFIARPGIHNCSYRELEKSILSFWKNNRAQTI